MVQSFELKSLIPQCPVTLGRSLDVSVKLTFLIYKMGIMIVLAS